jgi:uncharacterized LabA/DUF88 family protein
MSKRIGVFMDVSNLYYCCNQKYQAKLNYKAYLDFIKGYGDVTQAIAYGAQLKDEARKFIAVLEHLGFQAKYKCPKTFEGTGTAVKRKADWDVGIAMDIVQICLGVGVDTIFIGSADSDLVPVVNWTVNRGVTVVVLACGISRDLKDVATKWIEIPESMLEGNKSELEDQEEKKSDSEKDLKDEQLSTGSNKPA